MKVKAKVLVPFRDKETNKMYDKKGAIIELSVERFNEITAKGNYIQLVETIEEKQVKA